MFSCAADGQAETVEEPFGSTGLLSISKGRH